MHHRHLMKYQFNDGGRMAAGFSGSTGDCYCRAIAIATGTNYQTVYDNLIVAGETEKKKKRQRGVSHPRTGIYIHTGKAYLKALGWTWVPTMHIGSGCKVHLRDGELPTDRTLIVQVSRHLVAVVKGVIHDNHDCSRNETRCVYGYWYKET